MGDRNNRQSAEDSYSEAVGRYADARVRYAKEWQWQRSRTTSDNSATQATIEATGDEVTRLEAEVKIMAWRLQNERES